MSPGFTSDTGCSRVLSGAVPPTNVNEASVEMRTISDADYVFCILWSLRYNDLPGVSSTALFFVLLAACVHDMEYDSLHRSRQVGLHQQVGIRTYVNRNGDRLAAKMQLNTFFKSPN